VQGNNNSLRWNETSGNGYATGTAVDFGIGVVSGDGNIIEANTAIGNSNGIVVFPVATNNQVRQNVAVGNPPIQVSNSVPGTSGVDIWDQSPPGNNNRFLGNMCVTSINVACPNVATQAVPRKPGS
jgi:parallel beta-helix repeat protein